MPNPALIHASLEDAMMQIKRRLGAESVACLFYYDKKKQGWYRLVSGNITDELKKGLAEKLAKEERK